MKNQDSKINESSAEKNLLDSLFNLCVDKYADKSISLVETHFLKSVASLIDKGEIAESTAKEFMEENGIEGEIPTKKSKKTTYNDVYGTGRTYYDDSCGRSSYRSGC
jgi:small-conductance mechanosensitive channel